MDIDSKIKTCLLYYLMKVALSTEANVIFYYCPFYEKHLLNVENDRDLILDQLKLLFAKIAQE